MVSGRKNHYEGISLRAEFVGALVISLKSSQSNYGVMEFTRKKKLHQGV